MQEEIRVDLEGQFKVWLQQAEDNERMFIQRFTSGPLKLKMRLGRRRRNNEKLVCTMEITEITVGKGNRRMSGEFLYKMFLELIANVAQKYNDTHDLRLHRDVVFENVGDSHLRRLLEERDYLCEHADLKLFQNSAEKESLRPQELLEQYVYWLVMPPSESSDISPSPSPELLEDKEDKQVGDKDPSTLYDIAPRIHPEVFEEIVKPLFEL